MTVSAVLYGMHGKPASLVGIGLNSLAACLWFNDNRTRGVKEGLWISLKIIHDVAEERKEKEATEKK